MVKMLPVSKCLGRRVIAAAFVCVDRCQREPSVRVEASSADLGQPGSVAAGSKSTVVLHATMSRLTSGVME
jgi:hypothetical protein